MHRKVIAGAIIGLSFIANLSYSQNNSPADPNAPATEQLQKQDVGGSPLDTILEGLRKKATDLKSYECKVDYVVTQTLLESKTRRSGNLYYARFDGRSYLRVDFLALQQDEEPQQEYREQIVFDGVWLQQISYKTESVERRQIAEANKPVDAFALASRQVPMFGFSKVEDLHKQFEIDLVSDEQSESSRFNHLHLKVKPDSIYKDDYSTIDFWIDKTLGLPARVFAVGAEADVGETYEIKLLEPKVNTSLDRNVFQVSIPASFSVETIPLSKQQKQDFIP
jgi:outer membrane lipoprotein-sorting protein